MLLVRVCAGMFTKPVASTVLSLGRSIVWGLHSSFGDGDSSSDPEEAHVTWPLATGMERLGTSWAGPAARRGRGGHQTYGWDLAEATAVV